MTAFEILVTTQHMCLRFMTKPSATRRAQTMHDQKRQKLLARRNLDSDAPLRMFMMGPAGAEDV
jgi:hypothetical protein